MLFVDNSLVFYETSQDQMIHLCWFLIWFEACLGFKENLEKSKLTPIGSVDQVEELISVRGCKVSTLPSTYLRLPLGAPFRSLVVWDWVEERFRERLSLWKDNSSLKGGTLLSLAFPFILYLYSIFRGQSNCG